MAKKKLPKFPKFKEQDNFTRMHFLLTLMIGVAIGVIFTVIVLDRLFLNETSDAQNRFIVSTNRRLERIEKQLQLEVEKAE